MSMKYIRLKEDKSPYSNYNNTTEDLEVVEKWDNVGMMLPENIVVVDFDSREDIARDILNKSNDKPRAIKTDRGIHLYYKIPEALKIKNNSKVLTVLGCDVDYKTGQDKKKQYIIIKRYGKDREILSDTSLEDLPNIPLELMPLSFKDSVNLVNLKEGSRNDSLFKHLANARNRYKKLNDKDVLRQLAFVINNYMVEPLEHKELENIVESVMKYDVNYSYQDNEQFYNTLKNGSKKINIFKLSDYLQSTLNLTIFNGNMFFKLNDKYTEDVGTLYTFISKDMHLNLTKKEDVELIHQLSKTHNTLDLNSDLLVRFNNGYTLNRKGEIEENINDNFTPFYLDVAYEPKSYNQDVYDFLMWFMSNDKEMFEYIKRILGHILMYRNYPQFAFFFIGASGRNGKSTFFKMVANTFENVVSFLSIEEMNKETNLPLMQSKLVNVGDDINNAYIENSSIFKRVTSGEVVMSRALFNMSRPQRNFATLLFSCNDMPNFKDKTGGIERRIRGIPCDNTVSEDNIDYGLIDKLTTSQAKSYILNLAIEGMQDILRDKGKMNEPKKVLELSKEYMDSIDSVRTYIDTLSIVKEKLINKIIRVVYEDYTNFCYDNGYTTVEPNTFVKRINNIFRLVSRTKKINGDVKRVFKEKE
ncbi:phage/plasmid primase, P4 family [Streptobacillus moniliformis]|uniref:phage/plasmid primase, P4 family n=1 Tax=Streptobacillus moniliformis TaxID=34105 RepID=UPI0007E37823|nr:phage/plasmid primase, P4 family [Streptobacillus moniliformis]